MSVRPPLRDKADHVVHVQHGTEATTGRETVLEVDENCGGNAGEPWKLTFDNIEAVILSERCILKKAHTTPGAVPAGAITADDG